MSIGRFLLVAVPVMMLQIFFVPALRPLGVVPNAILVLVVLAGLLSTASAALGTALAGGLLLDLTSGDGFFGLRICLLALLALAAGLIHRAGLELSGPIMALGLVAVATVVINAAALIGLIGSVSYWPPGLIFRTLALEILLNMGLTLLMRPMIKWTVQTEPALKMSN